VRCRAESLVMVPWRFGGVADVTTLEGLQDPPPVPSDQEAS